LLCFDYFGQISVLFNRYAVIFLTGKSASFAVQTRIAPGWQGNMCLVYPNRSWISGRGIPPGKLP
jgi:hypothetical protein